MKKILTILVILMLCLSCCACDLTDNLLENEFISERKETPTSLESISLLYFSDKAEHPLSDTSLANQKIHTVVYLPAFSFDEQLQLVYGCATAVEQEDTRITITLDSGRLFSDGTRLNATHVAQSYQYVLEHPESPYYRQLSNIDSVTTQGGRVILTLKQPDKWALYCLDIPIVHEKDGNYYGCGDYMLGKYRDEPALVKNPHAKNQPKLSPIILLEPKNEEALAGMFNSGVLSVLSEDVMATGNLSIYREYESVEYLTREMLYVGINVREEMLDSAMRRALNAMMPREEILESVLMGKGVATAYPFYPLTKGLKQSTDTPISKRQLTELFTAAGLHVENGQLYTAQGHKPTFELLVCEQNKAHMAAAEKIRAAATAASIEITVAAVDEQTFATRLERGNFQLYIARYELGKNNDATALYTTDSRYNYGGVSLPSLEKAYNELGTSQSTPEDYIQQFARECPILPLAFFNNSLYFTKGIKTAGSISQSMPLGDLANWSIK